MHCSNKTRRPPAVLWGSRASSDAACGPRQRAPDRALPSVWSSECEDAVTSAMLSILSREAAGGCYSPRHAYCKSRSSTQGTEDDHVVRVRVRVSASPSSPFPYNRCMGQCSYCRKLLTGSEPLEHVIPQNCFGDFNLTLSCVCEECNRFFGRTLEWPMRNSSTEGVLRFVQGLGSGEIGNIGTKGIEIKLAEPPEWAGARVVLKADKQRHAFVDLLPQIAARSDANDPWAWYLEKNIDAAFAKKYPNGSEFRIVAPAPDHERLTNRLIKVCPSFKKRGDLASPIATDGTVGAAWITEFTLRTE